MFSSLFREEVVDMVTYSDLIQTGLLVVTTLNFFAYIYFNSKKK